MKRAYYFRIAIFLLIIILPLSKLNTTIEAVSDIDNKYLTDFPDIDLGYTWFMNQLEDYLNDRLGGRERLLQLNSTINDKAFNYLEHPSYEYGQDGYVFFKLNKFEEDFEFLDEFTDLLVEIQNYCHERDVPFIYNLNPAKWSVYTQYLPKGYHYENKRLAYLQNKLVEKNIVHVDATPLLQDLAEHEQVFNRQYDAGHWNAWGAFYSVNQLLEKMTEFNPDIKPNDIADFVVSEELITAHAVSKVKMHEYIPKITPKEKNWDYVDDDIRYDIIQSPHYRAFIRTASNVDNDVNLLFFHGSGYNGLGHPFVAEAIKNYQGIHNYQNLIDFDYYFNLFKPNFVVVNSAEYATNEHYFDIEHMQNKHLNPVLNKDLFEPSTQSVIPLDTKSGPYVTTVWFEDQNINYGYYVDSEQSYDLVKSEDGHWYFSGFNADVDLSQGKLYVVRNNGAKVIVEIGTE